MTAERCGYVKGDGTACEVTFALCSCHGQCFSHAPCREEERTAARRKGGYAAARGAGSMDPGQVPPAPQTLQDAVLWAAWAARAAATGELDTARANSAARLLKEFRHALEKSESREKLEEMRRRIEELAGDAEGQGLEVLP